MTNKGWWVSVPGPLHVYIQLQLANEIVKPQVSINSNNSSIDCSLQKTATRNGNLQPEIEINESAFLCSISTSAEYYLGGTTPLPWREAFILPVKRSPSAFLLSRLALICVL